MDQDFTEHEPSADASESAANEADSMHTDGPGVDLNERVARLHDATEAHLNRLRQQ